MNKRILIVLSLILVFLASTYACAAPITRPATKPSGTKAPAEKIKKTYSKMTEATYIQISVELRTYNFNQARSKPLKPQERMAQIDSIFDKYNVSKNDYRDFSLALRKDPKNFLAVNKKIDAKTKELTKK